MSEIPDSIMKAAREAINPWTIDDGSTAKFEACALSVARAIHAERLRCCASIAASFYTAADFSALKEGQ